MHGGSPKTKWNSKADAVGAKIVSIKGRKLTWENLGKKSGKWDCRRVGTSPQKT